MFKALLDWIRPTDNNAQLSEKFKKVLQRIIDTVFDSLQPSYGGGQMQQMPQLHRSQSQHALQDQLSQGPHLSTTTLFQNDLHPMLTTIDDLDWFNTFDWTQGDLLDQSNQLSQY